MSHIARRLQIPHVLLRTSTLPDARTHGASAGFGVVLVAVAVAVAVVVVAVLSVAVAAKIKVRRRACVLSRVFHRHFDEYCE